MSKVGLAVELRLAESASLPFCNCSGTLPKLNAHMLRVPTRRPFRSSLRSSLSYPSAHPYLHLQAEMQDATARGTARCLKLEGLPAYSTVSASATAPATYVFCKGGCGLSAFRQTSTFSAPSSSSRQRHKAPSSPSAPSPFSPKHLGPETPRTEEMRHAAEKEREKKRRAAPSLAPVRGAQRSWPS